MGARGSRSTGMANARKGTSIPKLSGTEKQISYANSLVTKTLSALKTAEEAMMKIAPNEQAKENARKNINYMRDELKGMKSAEEVIDTLKNIKFIGSIEKTYAEIAAAFRARMRGTFKNRRY